MVWKDLLPAMHLSCLFAGEFFPNWLHTLSLWLSSPTADFSEVCVYVRKIILYIQTIVS